MTVHWEKYLIILILIAIKSEELGGSKLPYITLLGTYSCGHTNKIIYISSSNFDSRYHILYSSYEENIDECFKNCCSAVFCNTVYFSVHRCIGINIPANLIVTPVNTPHLTPFHKEKHFLPKKRDIDQKELLSQSHNYTICQPSSHPCPLNEYCQVASMESYGICNCNAGTRRNSNGICVPDMSKSNESLNIPSPLLLESNQGITEKPNVTSSSLQTENVHSTTTIPPTKPPDLPRELVVNVSNKSIELKSGSNIYEDWATLSAYALGDHGSNYTYKWTLLSKPKNDEKGSLKDSNKQTVALQYLVIGVYQFKVEVTGPNAIGEAVGNITIVPAKHRNEPPIAKITPANMTVKLPNSAVILDGSESSDDSGIKSFHWEIVIGPIGYKIVTDNGKTLELKDIIPGNYTIMLEVEDEAGQKGNAIASLSVVKETDYPPTANAGGDKNIYLPVDNVILNGSLSSDDHGIVEWEWTKGPEDSGNAVDMQFTREPILRLGNLEEGHYQFTLKVADSSGQTGTSDVHVYVHSSMNSIPVSNAGNNRTIIIPNTSTVLDGSSSIDVSPMTHYLWKQLSGPKIATMASNNSAKVNVTDLTKGGTVFQLTLWNGNDSMKNSTSNVTITVVQEKNALPIANAGQDFKITLPTSAVIVNGSQSKDDVGISKWLWRRDETSLAAGNVIETSYKAPILVVTNVVPGRYMWNLTVWDDQGASSSDVVSIIVENPPYHMDRVEVVLGVGIESLSVAQKNNLIQKLQLLYSSAASNDVNFDIEDIYGMPLSGRTSLVIVGRRGNDVVSGATLSHQLRAKILGPSHPRMIDLPIISIDTVVCQNNCSGHGECIQGSRQCRCGSWWMESSFRKHFGDGIANCDWSVIYVFLGIICLTLVSSILIWLAAAYFSKKWQATPKKQNPKYSLLENHEESHIGTSRVLVDSDSESGSEVLFDARSTRVSKADRRANNNLKMQRIRK